MEKNMCFKKPKIVKCLRCGKEINLLNKNQDVAIVNGCYYCLDCLYVLEKERGNEK